MSILFDIVFIIYAIFHVPYFIIKRRWRAGMLQRFGFYDRESFRPIRIKRPVWIHAVSMGEMNCIKQFVTLLRRHLPDKPIIISTTTETGHATGKSILREGDTLIYFPLDISFIMRRLVGLMNPSLFVAVETEIWPNLIAELSKRGVPAAIINGRISERSFRKYLLVRQVMRGILSKVRFFAMQTEADAERIRRLGAPGERIKVTGNMKFDMPSDSGARYELHSGEREILCRYGRLIVAGSTHPGEEEAILGVFAKLKREKKDIGLVIAPRHVERGPQIEKLIKERGLDAVRVSTLDESSKESAVGDAVMILDVIGRLKAYYGVADVVFVGGSLIPYGGHNLAEPAVFSKAILSGPYVHNFRDMARIFREEDGLLIVNDEIALEKELRALLADDGRRAAVGMHAREVLDANTGASRRNAEYVRELIEGSFECRDGSFPIMMRDDIIAALLRPLLILLSFFYAAGAAFIDGLYKANILKARKADIPVICVGNITLGGTGKTPLTILISQWLKRSGKNPAVLTRGYGGDESHMLEGLLRGFPVMTGSDRARTAKQAFEELGCDCAVLDDGFQHRRIAKDFSVILIDTANPFGNGLLFPAGILREPLSSLERADFVFITKADMGKGNPEAIESRIREVNAKVGIGHMVYKASGFSDIMTGEEKRADYIRGRKIALLAGIANPSYFAWMANRLGAEIAFAKYFPDHHRYSLAELKALERNAREMGAESVLTTQKDEIRIRRTVGFGAVLPFLAMKISAEITKNGDIFFARLDSIFNS